MTAAITLLLTQPGLAADEAHAPSLRGGAVVKMRGGFNVDNNHRQPRRLFLCNMFGLDCDEEEIAHDVKQGNPVPAAFQLISAINPSWDEISLQDIEKIANNIGVVFDEAKREVAERAAEAGKMIDNFLQCVAQGCLPDLAQQFLRCRDPSCAISVHEGNCPDYITFDVYKERDLRMGLRPKYGVASGQATGTMEVEGKITAVFQPALLTAYLKFDIKAITNLDLEFSAGGRGKFEMEGLGRTKKPIFTKVFMAGPVPVMVTIKVQPGVWIDGNAVVDLGTKKMRIGGEAGVRVEFYVDLKYVARGGSFAPRVIFEKSPVTMRQMGRGGSFQGELNVMGGPRLIVEVNKMAIAADAAVGFRAGVVRKGCLAAIPVIGARISGPSFSVQTPAEMAYEGCVAGVQHAQMMSGGALRCALPNAEERCDDVKHVLENKQLSIAVAKTNGIFTNLGKWQKEDIDLPGQRSATFCWNK